MKKSLILIFTNLLSIIILINPGLSQNISAEKLKEAPYEFRKQFYPETYHPFVNSINKSPSDNDWTAAIDSIWGQGLPVEDKLAIFDTFWQRIDWYFACFQDLEVNWDSLRAVFRAEIVDTVSRGRFAAILTHLSLSLKEAHTNCEDLWVCVNTTPNPGVPLLSVGGWGDNGHFGAGLTPLADSTLLVYKVAEDHPLNLVAGDIVLGYGGMPWHEIYPQLINQQLPLKSFWWGCSPSAYLHSWLMSAGLNWHLFDTIDILKYSNKQIQHLPTSPLANYNTSLMCSEQLDIQGVSMPDMNNGELCTYGIVEGTQIGYIYVWGWFWEVSTEFYDAVYDLMYNHETIGLIIDFRLNYGGNMFDSNPGLNLLFNEDVWTIGFDKRVDTSNHLGMGPAAGPGGYVIHGNPGSYYDKPIAVLTGPGALSSGDQVALRMKFHPETRIFGKSTTTAFNAPTNLDLGNANYSCRYAVADAYLDSIPGHYLTHDEFTVDEEVWHNPDDASAGIDAVAWAAMRWIDPTVSLGEILSDNSNIITMLSNYPNPCRESTRITYNISNKQHVKLSVYNLWGEMISVLADQQQRAGRHIISFNTSGIPPGIYYYNLQTSKDSRTGKMMVIK